MTRHILKLIWNRKRTNLLMMAEILVSFLVLFAVTALGVYTADNWRRPIGYSIDNVWAIAVDMKQTSDDDSTATQQETLTQLLLALKNTPEIVHSAGTMLTPYQMGSSNSRYSWHKRDIEFGVAEVTDGFKDVLGLQIVEGRWFSHDDDGQAYDAVVINEDMRRDLFGNGAAVGQSISNDRSASDTEEPERERRVVGVVATPHGAALKLTLAAPPVDGEANIELCALLAKTLDVPRRAVQITHGEHNKHKTVRVAGVSLERVRKLG